MATLLSQQVVQFCTLTSASHEKTVVYDSRGDRIKQRPEKIKPVMRGFIVLYLSKDWCGIADFG